MVRVSVLSAIVMIVFVSGICHADSLVITYSSGKTQTVVLDEPSQGISSWQFVGGGALLQQLKQPGELPLQSEQDHVQKNSTPQSVVDKKLTEKSPEKKSNIRVKLNAKPLPD